MEPDFEQAPQQESQQTMGKTAPTLALGADIFPEMKTAKPGQVFKLSIQAKVLDPGNLEILSVENEDFADKNYSDIVNEDMGIESGEMQ